MKFSLRIVLLLIAFAMLPGCFQVETTVSLNPDGSGTIREKMLFSDMMIGQMNQMTKAFAKPGEKTKSPPLYDPQALRKKAAAMGPDVAFVKGGPLNEKGFKGYTATYSFKDINKLVLDGKGPGSATGLPGSSPDGGQNFQFRFTQGKDSHLEIRWPHPQRNTGNSDSPVETPPDTTKAGNTDMTPEQQKAFAELFKGMKFSMNIVINGRIKRSNATFRQGNRITLLYFEPGRMVMDAKNMELLQKIQPSSPQEAEALLKNMPGVKIEMNDPLEVEFTK